jgi:hypothetical protein
VVKIGGVLPSSTNLSLRIQEFCKPVIKDSHLNKLNYINLKLIIFTNKETNTKNSSISDYFRLMFF